VISARRSTSAVTDSLALAISWARSARKLGVAILLVGYCVSGALWAMEPTAGAGLVAALLAAGLVLVAIWMVAFTGQVAFRLATPARAPLN